MHFQTEKTFPYLPFTFDMQTANGLDMCRILQSGHSFANIAQHISESMKMHLFQSIIEVDIKTGVMIIKSTK
jgi:hypothetical protein